jgi:HK97 family phage major capsid protein
MTMMFKPPKRGIAKVRADASDATRVLAELQKTFTEFKAANESRLEDIKKGKADVVVTEKVDRINADVAGLQAAIDDINRTMALHAAGQDGKDGGQELTAEQRVSRSAHRKAFMSYFRRGEATTELHGLAVKAALQTGVDPDGGYTVVPEMERAIDRVLPNVSAMRSLATVRAISSDSYKKLVNLGGTASGWAGERQARPETATAAMSQLEFPAMEIYAIAAATQNLLNDSFVNLEAWLADEVATEFAEEEGAAFINGNGVNKPRGILGYTAVANASYAWGSLGYIASGTTGLQTTDAPNQFIDTAYAIKQGYRANATWLMNRTTAGAVRKLKDGDGVLMWQPSSQLGQPATLLGFPVVDDDNMPAVADGAFPIAFGDFRRGYLVVDRAGITLLRDPYTNKPFVMFYLTKRVGGGVQNFEAIKLLKTAAS